MVRVISKLLLKKLSLFNTILRGNPTHFLGNALRITARKSEIKILESIRVKSSSMVSQAISAMQDQ